ncbi:hypothetical protein GWI33_006939, partial [Rhynchophorus ferrugineus]
GNKDEEIFSGVSPNSDMNIVPELNFQTLAISGKLSKSKGKLQSLRRPCGGRGEGEKPTVFGKWANRLTGKYIHLTKRHSETDKLYKLRLTICVGGIMGPRRLEIDR